MVSGVAGKKGEKIYPIKWKTGCCGGVNRFILYQRPFPRGRPASLVIPCRAMDAPSSTYRFRFHTVRSCAALPIRFKSVSVSI